jgi:hypothetical protein
VVVPSTTTGKGRMGLGDIGGDSEFSFRLEEHVPLGHPDGDIWFEVEAVNRQVRIERT